MFFFFFSCVMFFLALFFFCFFLGFSRCFLGFWWFLQDSKELGGFFDGVLV